MQAQGSNAVVPTHAFWHCMHLATILIQWRGSCGYGGLPVDVSLRGSESSDEHESRNRDSASSLNLLLRSTHELSSARSGKRGRYEKLVDPIKSTELGSASPNCLCASSLGRRRSGTPFGFWSCHRQHTYKGVGLF